MNKRFKQIFRIDDNNLALTLFFNLTNICLSRKDMHNNSSVNSLFFSRSSFNTSQIN